MKESKEKQRQEFEQRQQKIIVETQAVRENVHKVKSKLQEENHKLGTEMNAGFPFSLPLYLWSRKFNLSSLCSFLASIL
jgi:hypothetical protein